MSMLDNNMSIPTDSGGGDGTSGMPPRTELYIVMGILTFLSIMGTAGNALVLYVFSKKRDRMTSTLFILALAFVDFTTCLIVIPYTIYIEYVDFHIRFDLLCKLYQFLITCNIPFSALIMVAIAIDRYFCICHPFLHAMNLLRAKIMIGCLGTMAAVIGIIVGLMYGVYQKVPSPIGPSPLGNMSVVSMNNTGAHLGLGAMQGSPAQDGVLDVQQAETLIFNNGADTDRIQVLELYTGHCAQNEFVLSSDFAWYYQKFYTAMYLVCLIIVIILYVLIYRSVLARRTKRAKAKSKALPLTVTSINDNNGNSQEETLLTTVNGDMTTTTTVLGGTTTPPAPGNNNMVNSGSQEGGGSPGGGSGGPSPTAANSTQANTHSNSPAAKTTSSGGAEVRNGSSSLKIVPADTAITKKPSKRQKNKEADEEKRRKSTKKDRNRSANLKTAVMLFVVTAVFVVTFLPAFLMALQLIPYSMTVFYMYFANNVANPVIYSFMNKNFRDDLKKLFCGR